MPDRKTNPVLPFTEITIGDKTYKLACTFRGLRMAGEELRRRGIETDLLMAKLQPSLDSVCILFAAALVPYHPEIDFESAQDMVSDDNLLDVMIALDATRARCMPPASEDDDSPADPPTPS